MELSFNSEFFERCGCFDKWYCDFESNTNVGNKMKPFLLKNEVKKWLFCAPKIELCCNVWKKKKKPMNSYNSKKKCIIFSQNQLKDFKMSDYT